MFALRPPAHSTWATLRPPRTADWAIVSAWSTPGSNAAVRFAKGWPLTWKVLLVEPCVPGHAPVASVYQPAPVFGVACVRRPFPAAWEPVRIRFPSAGSIPFATCRATMSWRRPSAAKNTARPLGKVAAEPAAEAVPPPDGAAMTGPTAVSSRLATPTNAIQARRVRPGTAPLLPLWPSTRHRPEPCDRDGGDPRWAAGQRRRMCGEA